VLSTAHHIGDIITPKPRFKKKPHTILTVARLTGVKNQQLTLQALSQLSAQGEKWRVVFVGEGPRREELGTIARKLGLESKVSFTGQVERGEALWKYFDDADCFVLSSRSEGTPKVLLEAMARGLPIVASAVAGVPTSVKHEERGLLFEDNNVDALVASLRRIAAEVELRERMVANANRFCIEHTVERATEHMLQKVFARWPHLRRKKEATA
jgi:glycosyltransferase involved in cell wall biosynthesis